MGEVSPFTAAIRKAHANLTDGYGRAVGRHAQIPLMHETRDPRVVTKEQGEDRMVAKYLGDSSTRTPPLASPEVQKQRANDKMQSKFTELSYTGSAEPVHQNANPRAGIGLQDPPKTGPVTVAPPKTGRRFKNPYKREAGFVKDPSAIESGRGPDGMATAVGYSGSNPMAAAPPGSA